jgi:hypothetical protein
MLNDILWTLQHYLSAWTLSHIDILFFFLWKCCSLMGRISTNFCDHHHKVSMKLWACEFQEYLVWRCIVSGVSNLHVGMDVFSSEKVDTIDFRLTSFCWKLPDGCRSDDCHWFEWERTKKPLHGKSWFGWSYLRSTTAEVEFMNSVK